MPMSIYSPCTAHNFGDKKHKMNIYTKDMIDGHGPGAGIPDTFHGTLGV